MNNAPTGLLDPILLLLPLWLVGLLTIAACLAALWAGTLLYRWRAGRERAGTNEISKADGHIVSAIFSLLAFGLGFTYGEALDRFDVRRGLVTEEANAIGSAYMRASLFDEPHRTRLQSLIRDYAHTRLAPRGLWDEGMDAQLRRSVALKNELWAATRAAVYPVRSTVLGSAFVESVTDTFKVGTRRRLMARANIPTRILDNLFLCLLVSSGILGYLLGRPKSGHRYFATLMIVLYAATIVLILDIDRPRAGTFIVSQRAMEELLQELDQDFERRTAPAGAAAGHDTR